MGESIIPKAKAAEELQFVKRQLSALQSQRVKLEDTYAPPESKRARRAPIASVRRSFPDARSRPQIPLAPPPDVESDEDEPSAGAAGTIALTVVSAKPALSYSLEAEPTASIAALKAQVAAQADAPGVDHQRWLLGGKAMVDAKLLREYEGVLEQAKSGPVKINLFVKAGWAPASSATTTPKIAIRAATGDVDAMTVPSLGFEPSTPTGEDGPARRGPAPGLVLDTSAPLGDQPIHGPPASESEAFATAVADPSFWLDVHALLVGKLGQGEDSRRVWEAFLGASKGWLTPSQIAAARERVGISGMAGL